jgi:hypothetical protein
MPTDKNRPLSPQEAPDTARVYERARPEAEAGMGRLDAEKCAPARSRDKMLDAVSNKHPSRQLNADDSINAAGGPVHNSSVAPNRKTRRDVAAEKQSARQRAKKRSG